MKSTAKAESLSRNLKDRLEFRGFSVSESKDAEGWPKLIINTDEISLEIKGLDAISKDIINQDLYSFAGHKINFASRDDANDTLKSSKVLLEVVKMGIEKTIVKTHATDLAAAEALDGEELIFDVTWPSKGV